MAIGERRQDAAAAGRQWRSPVDGRLVASEERGEIVLQFGQHRRTRLGEVPAAYLAWMFEAAMLPEELRTIAGMELLARVPAATQEELRAKAAAGGVVTAADVAAVAADRSTRPAGCLALDGTAGRQQDPAAPEQDGEATAQDTAGAGGPESDGNSGRQECPPHEGTAPVAPAETPEVTGQECPAHETTPEVQPPAPGERGYWAWRRQDDRDRS